MSELAHQGLNVLSRLYNGSRHARWAVAGQAITSGANFATTLIIVRALGLEEFGRFSICFILIMITRNFLNGTVLLPMSTIAPKLRNSSIEAYRGFLTLNNIVFAAGSSLVLFAAAMPLGTVLNAPSLPSLALSLAAANFAANGSDFVRRYHFVYRAPVRAFWVDAVRFSVQLGAMLLMGGLVPAMFSAETSLYAMAAGSALGYLVGMFGFGRMRWSAAFARALWPRHWNFIKWMTPSVALETVQGNAPLLIGGALLGEGALGLVRAMQSLANVLNLPFNALQQIAPSMASAAYAHHGVPALKKVLVTMTAWSSMVVLALSITILAFFEPLIGDGFRANPADGLPILLAYCALNLAIVLRFPFMITLQTVEKLHVVTAANVLGTLLVVTSTAFAVNLLGAPAIPLASILVVAVTGLAYLTDASFRRRPENFPDPL